MTGVLDSPTVNLMPTASVRSARLLFSDRLADGRVTVADLARADVLGALSSVPVPSLPVRYAQRLGMKRDRSWFEDRGLAPLLAVREQVLGIEAPAPPRFLVRVDEYPLAGAYQESDPRTRSALERFHSILTDAGVPYLMAVSPAVARDYLDPREKDVRWLSDRELATLGGLRDDGVEFGLHGFNHRTRDARPRRHSELAGLESEALGDLLDRSMDRLGRLELSPRVFVPPFNRFDPPHYSVLADRFDAVCGGPETVALLGFHLTPLWRETAAYVPAYAPFYGYAATIADAVRRSIDAEQGVWIPIVLHWSWEAGAWESLEKLAGALAGYAHTWSSFLEASVPSSVAPFVANVKTAVVPDAIRPASVRLRP